MTSNIKHSGQVFTPAHIVRLILDEAGYRGIGILRKHCMENSCGNGSFLREIVARYISAYRDFHGTVAGVARELEEYIHGIEIDPAACRECIANLKSISRGAGAGDVTFDIRNADTLMCDDFDNSVDYVIGNPPYVRVHNLAEKYDAVKSFSFARGGMTDMYLVFFEKGFAMLKDGGKLCYITPSSWINSVAGSAMRDHVRRNRNLVSLIDLEHYQAFDVTTYTMVSLFEKNRHHDRFSYSVLDPDTLCKRAVGSFSIPQIDINGCFYLSPGAGLESLRPILSAAVPRYVTVKNGFATLADKVFIAEDFPFDHFVIPVIKASTGKWYKAFFPYDRQGRPLDRRKVFGDRRVAEYLEEHKDDLLKGDSERSRPYWHLFGRSQALKDVASDKLAINATIRDLKSIKINRVPAGSGVYSGLYILSSDIDFGVIEELLMSQRFIDYVASLKKYKNSGYYTFNSGDLEAYLNYSIHAIIPPIQPTLGYDDE